MAFNFFCLVPNAAAVETDPTVTTIVTPGGDDTSYQIPLEVSVIFDGVTYNNVYATTNSVITFGRADGTYWDYPTTPSISIESKDWWALPHQMPDTHFIINVSQGGFQVDGNYRPYGTWTGQTTSIIITAQIQTDGQVAYTYVVDGPLDGNERTGARLADGAIVTLEEAGVVQVEEVPVLEPTPVSPTPEPESVVPLPVEPQPEPAQPSQPSYPSVSPVEPPQPIEPELPVQEVEPELPSEVIPEEPVEPEVPLEPLPEPVEEQPIEPLEPPVVEEEPTVTLDNGVVLTETQATAVALLQNPGELIQEIFTNPAAALAALGSVGADMSPEVREKSEKVVISAVIAGNIATQAAAGAAATAAYRRKP